MKKPIVTLKTNRDYYDAKECVENSMSVGGVYGYVK